MEPAPEIKYKRLTWSGSRGGFFVAVRSRTSLWLGPDHLLSVDSNNYTETYKRFYFRDIQAIVVQKTKRFLVWNIIVGGIVLLSLIVTAFFLSKTASNWDTYGPPFFVFCVITGLFLMVLILNFIAGPTCKTFLRTAVQIEQMPSLSRVRKTRKVLKKIHPLIVEAQGGELSPEAISAQLRQWSEPAPQAASPTKVEDTQMGGNLTVEDDPNLPPRLDA